MVPGGELRHDPPVDPVQLHLAVKLMRQEPLLLIEDRRGTFVAGGLESEHLEWFFCLCHEPQLELRARFSGHSSFHIDPEGP